jgi:hypothetical protein
MHQRRRGRSGKEPPRHLAAGIQPRSRHAVADRIAPAATGTVLASGQNAGALGYSVASEGGLLTARGRCDGPAIWQPRRERHYEKAPRATGCAMQVGTAFKSSPFPT